MQNGKLNARAATADLSFSLSHNPENEFLIEIPDNISDKEDQKMTFSLFGNIGPSGLHFFENFKKVLLNRSGNTMNSTFWLNRIVFCIFKSIPTMISKALLAIGVEYERYAVSRFSNGDVCLEDIEF
ncbi:hypothetical protein P9112_000479 [Eukaryota sp. TZLM1-RC]